jgi:hypothetical protein
LLLAAQVKGAHSIDYITLADRLKMLKGLEEGIALMNAVQSPYLVTPPIEDIIRRLSHLLRAAHHQKWVDAFFNHERAGACSELKVQRSAFSCLAYEESEMAITFAYDAEAGAAGFKAAK